MIETEERIELGRYVIDDLREKIKDYYGTAATVIGNGNPFGCPSAVAELIDADYLSDEEIVEKARDLGLI